MRQVAEEERLARRARDHFGPLVPRLRRAVLEEELDRVPGARAPAQTHERGDVAPFVRGVVLPLALAVAAAHELTPVTLESAVQQLRRQPSLLPARRQRDGRGGGIEIAQLGRARQEIDVVLLRGGLQRSVQVLAELVARGGEACHIVDAAQLGGDLHRVLVAAQRPEVVPVRMHRLGRIAFVADRHRHHPVERRVARPVLLGAFAEPQLVHVLVRGQHVRPHLFQERTVAAVAVVVGDAEDQLAVAVVLRHRIAAAVVHAARHHAVGELVRRVPVKVFACHVGAAQAQQAFGNHRAVTDPAARIRARARLQARPDPRDQHVRQRGAQGVGQRLALGRNIQLQAIQLLAPLLGHQLLRTRRIEAGWQCLRTGLRDQQGHVAHFARRQAPSVQQRARGQPVRILRLLRQRGGVGGQPLDVDAGVERRGVRGVGLLHREHARLAVDLHLRAVERQRTDRADPADGVEELAGRVHLERPHRQRQGVVVRRLARVAEPVARHQLRLLRGALHEGGDAQGGVIVAPVHAGDRQVVVLQALRALHVGPAQTLAVQQQERLDAEAALAHFDRTVLADQALLAAAVQADDGPVWLLAAEATREPAAGGIGRHRLDEIVRGRSEGQRLQRDVGDAVAEAGAVLQVDAHVARLGLGQRQPVGAAVAGADGAQLAPAAAVGRALQLVARGVHARRPLHFGAAEFAHLPQVQHDRLGLGVAAVPHRVGLAVGDALLQRRRGVSADLNGQWRAILRRQRGQAQLVEAHRALAADLVVEGELDLRAALEFLVRTRAPGLVDLPLLEADRAPLLGKVVARPVDPPHVVAAGVDQLELQVVARRIAAQLERELVVVRILDRDRAADPGIAGDAVEVVVQADRLGAAAAGGLHQPGRSGDLVGDDDLPVVEVVEAVQRHRRGRRRGEGLHRRQAQDGHRPPSARHRHSRHEPRSRCVVGFL